MDYVASKKVNLHIKNADYWTGLTEDGFFTNGYYAVIPSPKDSLPKEMYDKDKVPAVATLILLEEYKEVKFECIIQESKYKTKPYDILVTESLPTDEKGNKKPVYLNREFVDTILCRFPEASPYVVDHFHAVLFKNPDGELVGIVMPIVID